MRCPACGYEADELVPVLVAVGLGSATSEACTRCAVPIVRKGGRVYLEGRRAADPKAQAEFARVLRDASKGSER